MRTGLLFAGITAAILLIQTLTGVWTSDLGADPDEPAHAVTSLMVRDYLASGFSHPPLAFAQQYYEDFPKVALGHYPPVYYALGGVLLLLWPQPQMLLILQAVLIGLLALQVYVTGRRMLNERAALAAAVMCAGFPVTIKLSQLVMADLLLACLCLLAVESWARFLEKPRLAQALIFGVSAAAAILTKGSGLALAVVPVVSLVCLGRWELLKKPVFWLASLPVAVLAGPWMLYSSKITKEGMVSTGVLDFAWGGIKFYAMTLSGTFGFTTVMVAVAGLLVWTGLTQVKIRADVRRCSLLGMLLGTVLIMLLVPAGYSSRYLMPLAPVVALMAVSFFQHTLGHTRLCLPGLVSLALLVWLQVPGLLVKNVRGYGSAVQQALGGGLPESGRTQWLVCADPRGEGAVIAAAAFALPERSPSPLQIHRGSKKLATADWLGRDYKTAFKSPEELRGWLDARSISRVFVDSHGEESVASPHEKLLLQTLRNAEGWRLEREEETTRPYEAVPGRLAVYVRMPE